MRLGISQSPEGRRCFQRMTVRENLELGAYLRRDANITDDLDRVLELFPRLREREKQKAGTMSGGEQQMLAMGRALMADPTLLLLDEPSMGLAPILVDRIYETVREINQQGTTILLVEQNANYALEVSKRGYVLETGKVVLADESDGAPGEPRSPERLPGDMTMTVFALLGATALWLLYAWLAVGDRRLVPVRPQGLRRAGRPRLRPAAQRRSASIIWLIVPAEAGVAVEEGRPVGPRRAQGPDAARQRRARRLRRPPVRARARPSTR